MAKAAANSGASVDTEPRALHNLQSECLLVILQRLLPARLSYDDVPANCLSVRQKLVDEADDWDLKLVSTAERRSAVGIAIRSLVNALDEIAGLLKFNR